MTGTLAVLALCLALTSSCQWSADDVVLGSPSDAPLSCIGADGEMDASGARVPASPCESCTCEVAGAEAAILCVPLCCAVDEERTIAFGESIIVDGESCVCDPEGLIVCPGN